MMATHPNSKTIANKSNGSQFPASTFPETFKDFFSMINEDEDQVELVSNLLEDKVIPRYNVRGRNRSSSAKYSNSTSLLPASGLAVRSNSFRVNRSKPSNATARDATGTVSDFCKHIKYCCLHQNITSVHNLNSDQLDRSFRTQDFSDGRMISLGSQFKFNELNTNSYSNFSDDEKSMKFNNKFSVDKNNTPNATKIIHKPMNKPSYDSFESRICNCENCSANDFRTESNDEFYDKMKSTGSSFCLLRHNRNANQAQRGNERSTSGASNLTFNFINNSSNALQEKSTESTTLTSSSNMSNRSKMELGRQKSPILNRRRSSITLARTVPNFGATTQNPVTMATSPVHNLPNDLYRYIKNDDQQQHQPSIQQWNHQLNEATHGNRLEGRDKYTRSKSPNILNRKTIEVSSPAVIKASSSVVPKQQQRARTASMPAENRKPRLADTRRSAIHCADMDIEYYRLRSFSITSHGICNLGDSMRSRRSRSINSVTSSNSGRDRNNSTGSQFMDEIKQLEKAKDEEQKNVAYKIAMLGDSGVGKTALTYQFTTSEYICAYDLSLDDDYGQKTVSVLLNNQETDLEVIDHPACEMSVEAFCSTYSIDLFVIAYSVVDRKSFKVAERILLYLKENEMMLTRGAILVGNKTDLERQREVTTQAGRKLAKEIGCKFIETSSGLDHNVDELLVGIVAQVKLNPQRIRNLSEKQRTNLCMTSQQKCKGTSDHDHFTQLRRNQRNKSNMKKSLENNRRKSKGSLGGAGNKENIHEEDESDDERSSYDGNDSDIEKYLNLDEKTQQQQHGTSSGETMHMNRLLNARRYATPGMSTHYGGVMNPFHNNNGGSLNNSNTNLSSSSSSTPTALNAIPGPSTSKPQTRRDSYEIKNQPSNSLTITPKKLEMSGGESDGSNGRCINRLSNRTKLFLTSFLKFKRSLRVKRRNSSSCSDLFVI